MHSSIVSNSCSARLCMSALPYRQNVEALKRQVDELERLTSDERNGMDLILNKADLALSAQKTAATSASVSVAKRTPLTSRQPDRRPAPPAAPSSTSRHQRPLVSNGASTSHHGSSESGEKAIITASLLTEGWPAAHVRAALVATRGTSIEAARGWLESMPQGAPAAQLSTDAKQTNSAPPASPLKKGVAGSAMNVARGRQQQSPSSNINDAGQQQLTQQPLPPPRVAASPSTLSVSSSIPSTPFSTVVAREPSRALPSSHRVQATTTSEVSRATPAIGFEAFEAQTITARGLPFSHSSPPVSSTSAAPTVAIQIRDSRTGTVHHLGGKLFHEHDTLKAVVVEYFRLHPQTPAPRIGCDVRLVVPWLQRSYSHEQLTSVTLKEASLCPTATIVLQVAKHV